MRFCYLSLFVCIPALAFANCEAFSEDEVLELACEATYELLPSLGQIVTPPQEKKCGCIEPPIDAGCEVVWTTAYCRYSAKKGKCEPGGCSFWVVCDDGREYPGGKDCSILKNPKRIEVLYSEVR